MTKEIGLTQGRVAIVDDDDFERVNQYKWYLEHTRGKKYAARKRKHTITVKMHRMIMNPLPGFEVDHINGNGLDNRKQNLRVCTHQENVLNRSPNKRSQSRFKGVSYYKGKWVALITYRKKRYYLGRYLTENDAAQAYKQKAVELHRRITFALVAND